MANFIFSMPTIELPHVDRVDERGWRDRLAHDLWHSPLIQSARFVNGLVTSPIAYFQGINGHGELAKWLTDSSSPEARDERTEKERVRDFFSTVRNRIDEQDTILGTSAASDWNTVKTYIRSALRDSGEGVYVSDEIVFARDGSWWGMGLSQKDSKPSAHFYHVSSDGFIEHVASKRDIASFNDYERECFLIDTVEQITDDTTVVRNVVTVSPITNNVAVIHDSDWEREAGVVTRLVNRGSDSHDEIESLIQITLRRGLTMSDDGASILLPNEKIRSMFEELYALSIGREHDLQKRRKTLDIAERIDETFRRHLYHRYADEWLVNNPEIVKQFMRSSVFMRGREILNDHSMAAVGQSYFQDARNLLANVMLWNFEGYKHLADSPSQKQFAGHENDFYEVLRFYNPIRCLLLRMINDRLFGIRISNTLALRELHEILHQNDWLPAGLDTPCSLSWYQALQENYEVVFRQKLDDVRKKSIEENVGIRFLFGVWKLPGLRLIHNFDIVR